MLFYEGTGLPDSINILQRKKTHHRIFLTIRLLPRVADKQLFDEVFSKLAGVLEEVMVKVIVECGDVVVCLLLTVAKEWRGATQPAQNQRQNQPKGSFKSSADNASP